MSYEEWCLELADRLEVTVEQLQVEVTSLYYLWRSGVSVREAYDTIKFQGVS